MAIHPELAGLTAQAHDEGYARGAQEGYGTGTQEGYNAGAQEGYQVGVQHGMQQQQQQPNQAASAIVAGLGLQQQDGQNFGDPQAQEVLAKASQLADAIMGGQVNPTAVQAAAQQGDPVAANAIQILQQQQEVQQNSVPAPQQSAQ